MDLMLNKFYLKVILRLLILVYVIVPIKECNSQEYSRCISKETCGECIGEDPTCAWCSQKIYSYRGTSRCDTFENLKKGRCDNIVSPNNSITHIEDSPLSRKGAKEGEAIQIKPQVIRVDLRPNSIGKFSVKYRQAVDYPVDLYLLMDLSYTMKDDKENLARLGKTLGNEMRRITTNFKLGFGSFVDKVVAPYSKTHPSWIESPCANRDCVKAYSFKNHMSLSSDITEFITEVTRSRVSANIDKPEGTLDAIMQTIVCKDEIGWRPKSRKLIVIATDEDFHYAGDGKLGGIIKPNDCECHLDSNGYYTMSDRLDYPSMSQMKKIIKEHNVYLIFAVPQNRFRHYQILSTRLTATTVGMLAKDSSNIVTLIREQYDKISSTIQMTETAEGPHNIKVSYYSECLEGKGKKRNICTGIRPGNTVTFDVSMEFSVCPKNSKDWRQKIEIHPVGLSDSLIVNLDMICQCDCPGDAENVEDNKKSFCSGRGRYECGVCKCDGTAYGTACECDIDRNPTESNSSACIYGNNEYVCSNRGECRCGKCFCDKKENPEEQYSGKFCECSNFNCLQKNEKMCNGQGTCICGTCSCKKGWSGDDCTCNDSPEYCVLETGMEPCSGHGTCRCGSCNCEENYYGKFCEDCLSCQGECQKYSACVQCALSADSKGTSPKLCESCKGLAVEVVEKTEVNETQKEKICSMEDKDNCKITFKYKRDDYNFVSIRVQLTKECPTPADLATIAGSTVGGVLFAGMLALLLVKILTDLHDRREWAKFQKDLDKAQWDSGHNPIFIEPSSTFQNPAFGES